MESENELRGTNNLMYQVPKLEDYSPVALDQAATEMLAALDAEVAGVMDAKAFEDFRNRWMSRKSGIFAQINDTWLKAAPGPSKRDVGQRVNALKSAAEERINAAQSRAAGSASGAKIAAETVDISLPGIQRPLGVKHPILRVLDELIDVFVKMGYSVAEGPEVETDYYNFEALNFPPNHPARDTQDTLFIAGQEKRAQRDRL